MKDLNQFVSMYLDYAERQAKKDSYDDGRLGEKIGCVFGVE